MPCSHPASDESLRALRRLRDQVRNRGDECLAVMLSGVDVYASLGREWELLEVMKKFADEMHEVVHNTPTAEELEELYRITDTRPEK
ncbi:MAG: hypothetical protein ACRD9L_00470 [Bryobacteraceae bacterium]